MKPLLSLIALITLNSLLVISCQTEDALYSQSQYEDRKIEVSIRLNQVIEQISHPIPPDTIYQDSLKSNLTWIQYSIQPWYNYRFEPKVCCRDEQGSYLKIEQLLLEGFEFQWQSDEGQISPYQNYTNSFDNTDPDKDLQFMLVDSLKDSLFFNIHLEIDTSIQPQDLEELNP